MSYFFGSGLWNMLGCVCRILPLKLCLSHSLWNLPKLGLKYKIMKVVSLPLTTDHVLEADSCLAPTISACLVCSIMGWKGTRICSSGTQGYVTHWLKPHTRKLSIMFPLPFLRVSSSLKEKEEAASFQKSLQGVLEGKGKWWREQGRGQELEDGVL